jgi:hypothetical protein
MKKSKNYAPLLVLFILLVSILVSSCGSCQSSKYRRRNFANIETKETIQLIKQL